MFKSRQSATAKKYSIRFANRKRPAIQRNPQSVTADNRLSTLSDQGKLYCKILGGVYQMRWHNPETGQRALAFGSSFQNAFQNLRSIINNQS